MKIRGRNINIKGKRITMDHSNLKYCIFAYIKLMYYLCTLSSDHMLIYIIHCAIVDAVMHV